ncbi:hypothetical protein HDU87_007517 [Geranomyces variabilis]|uniref:Coatomer subunit epsilon n=1 Tax=Geranomyces variabilis TaxID=109894 RepID=A0AAD5XSV9_9FUNG|nr:hypothetical protein HDU87_007517 [Geranomyces variabilis]
MGDFVDELRILRNNFYLGSYAQVIAESAPPPGGVDSNPERTALYYRAQTASGNPRAAQTEIPASAPAELQAVKLQAAYVIASKNGGGGAAAPAAAEEKARAVAALAALLADSVHGLRSTVQAVCGAVFYQEERYGDALVAVAKSPRNLECVALAIQCYLKLDRTDLARKEVEKLKTWADDATLAQLAEAWVSCFLGQEQNVMDAQYIFEELASSKLSTGRLVTGLAVCKMQAGKFPEAERILLEGLSRYAADADLVANLIVCTSALGKPAEDVARIVEKLKEINPRHPLLEDLALKESLFARAAQRYVS